MAKQPTPTDVDGNDGEVASKAKSARKLLIAALVLSVASLGAGFFLAKTAFLEDSATFEPNYVEDSDQGDGHQTAVQGDGGDGGHSEAETLAAADKDPEDGDGHGEEGEDDGKVEGVLEFGDILANINGFNAQGKPTRGFLKLKLVMIYRPDTGSKLLMEERQPFMRDLFNGYVRSLTEADLRGMAGIIEVKAELLKRARAAAGNDLPQEILISDLIVQ